MHRGKENVKVKGKPTNEKLPGAAGEFENVTVLSGGGTRTPHTTDMSRVL